SSLTSLGFLALELQAPPPLRVDLRPCHAVRDAVPPLGFSLANDTVGPPAAFLDKLQRFSSERGQQRPAPGLERVDDHTAGVCFLDQLGAVGATAAHQHQGQDCGP
ncbi:MAG: hypothetical protein ACREIS_00575, partial [Nitrospiraceae bacterium]